MVGGVPALQLRADHIPGRRSACPTIQFRERRSYSWSRTSSEQDEIIPGISRAPEETHCADLRLPHALAPKGSSSNLGGVQILRLAMWSGPRNISTAMMRSWGNRADTVVVDEPLYAFYLQATGKEHPVAEEVIASGETDWRKVIEPND